MGFGTGIFTFTDLCYGSGTSNFILQTCVVGVGLRILFYRLVLWERGLEFSLYRLEHIRFDQFLALKYLGWTFSGMLRCLLCSFLV